MQTKSLCALTFSAALTTLGIVVSPPAVADCNYSGGTTLCANGSVTGGSAPSNAPFDPYACDEPDNWTCAYYDDWDPNVYLDLPEVGGGPIVPERPGIGDRPNRPDRSDGGNRPGGGRR